MAPKLILFSSCYLLASLLFLTSYSTSVSAYPKNEFDQCMQAAKSNPAVDGITDESLRSFCDCALRAIVDEGRNNSTSAKKCAKENLNT